MIEPVVVGSAWRGRGVGTALLAHVRRAATERGHRWLMLKPVGRNIDAIRFFHREGFGTLGQIELLSDLGSPRYQWQRAGDLHDLPFDA
jgi:GNAT superfamily N-acetyltransferase